MKNTILNTIAVIVSITIWVPNVAQAAEVSADTAHDAFDAGNGISSWEWLDPNVTMIRKDESTTYKVGAWDEDGVNRIEIYINGEMLQSCIHGNAPENAACDATIEANDYPSDTDIFVNSKIVDATDRLTWTQGYTIYRAQTEISIPNNADMPNQGDNHEALDYGNGIASWEWMYLDVPEIYSNESTTYNVGAWDEDGINRIEIYLNGQMLPACTYGNSTDNASCDAVLEANSFPSDTDAFVNAKIVDATEKYTWTQGFTVHRMADETQFPGETPTDPDSTPTPDPTSTPNETPDGDPAQTTYVVNVWDWTDDDITSIATDGSVKYHAGVWAEKGIKKIIMYVDNQKVYTCTYWPGSGNQECWTTINGQSQTPGSTVLVNALVIDNKGQEVWTEGKTITIESGSGDPAPTPNETPDGDPAQTTYVVNVWDWTDDEITSITTDQSVAYHAGVWAERGVKKIIVYIDNQESYTCNYWPGTGNKECWTTIHGNGRAPGSTVLVNALVIDNKGQEVWTEGKTITIESGSGDPAPTPNETPDNDSTPLAYALNVWDWTDDELITLSANGTLVYHAGAWAETGLRKIILYVDNQEAYTCTYFPGTGNQECWTTIHGQSYTPGTSIYVNALVRDAKNQEVWTEGKTITITQ